MDGLSPEATRAQALAQIEAQDWDIVVIGGGISGAGVAQQAAAQGWRVLLVEQQDFAWGTSSRSSKLVHGGLRYLAQGDVATTWHSVRERQRLLREAPGLVVPQRFLLPDCAGAKPSRRLTQTGLALYDLMAGQRGHFYADQATTQQLAPGLAPPALRGALVFQDASTDDARLVLRVLQEARLLGAVTLNYVAALALRRTGGGMSELALQERPGGQQYTARARCVVNASGAWADALRPGRAPLLRPLRGGHLIVPFWRLPLALAISFMHPQDGRPVFCYPWEGATLIGTTDLEHRADLAQEARISGAEVDYLLAAVNAQFPGARLGRADISACYAGVRPVLQDGQQSASKATREHLVLAEDGLITLTGGKLTTFRLMAQDALALAAAQVGQPFARSRAPVFAPASALLAHWPAAVRARLTARYGSQAAALCAGASADLLAPVGSGPTLWLELAIAARCEAVQHLDDLLLRRTRLGLLHPQGAQALLPQVQALCAPLLGWSSARWQQEETRYRQIVAQCYQTPEWGSDSNFRPPAEQPN